jgi:Cu(I)/Ag(I) efflux system membrane protein CusA/SilA
MTVLAAFVGLLPILLSQGTGSDMMKRVVAPMIGGLVTSFVLELLVYPPLYEMWKRRRGHSGFSFHTSSSGHPRIAGAP